MPLVDLDAACITICRWCDYTKNPGLYFGTARPAKKVGNKWVHDVSAASNGVQPCDAGPIRDLPIRSQILPMAM